MWEKLDGALLAELASQAVRPEVLPILGMVMSLLVLGALSLRGTRRGFSRAEVASDDEAR